MEVLYIFIAIAAISIIGCICYFILKSPFKYPYYIIDIDISGRHSPLIEDIVDEYLIANGIGKLLVKTKYQKAPSRNYVKNNMKRQSTTTECSDSGLYGNKHVTNK